MKRYLKAFLIILIIGLFSIILVKKSLSGSSGNITGWVWSGSFNDQYNGCMFSPENCGNSGWVSLSSSNDYAGKDPNGATYGLNVPSTDGPVTGYIWSSNLGWIDFQPINGFPTTGCKPTPCPDYGVKRVGDDFFGWAKILSMTGADEGWIKSSGIANDGSSYGVTVDQIAQTVSGKMWSNDIGWLDVNGTFSNPPCDPATDPSCAPPQIGLNSTCSGTPNPAYISTGGNINWKATVISDGVPPYTYSWTFTPAPDSKTGSNDQISAKYSVPGLKSATVEILDSVGSTTSSTCNVDMLKTGKVKETIPLPLE